MNLLFIGNSHTYYNSLPETVMQLFEATGQKCHVTMLTEGGKGLAYHASSPNTLFNIRCGKYDIVIVQEKATGFDPVSFKDNAKLLREMTEKTGAQFYLYMPWAGRDNRAAQRTMTDAYDRFARANGCAVAPAGEVFTRILTREKPGLLYREDGNHATPFGSYLAALTIFYTLTERKRVMNVSRLNDPGIAAGFDPELCQRGHTEACHVSRIFNG
jgi:hypothetical protein